VNRANRVFLLFLASACISPSVRAQGVGDCQFLGKGEGVVRGRLLTTTDGLKVQRGVRLTDSGTRLSCSTLTDAVGRFRFGGVPPGHYELTIGSLGIQRIGPLPFSIDQGGVADFRLPLHPEDPILDCLRLPECAVVLTRVSREEEEGGEPALEAVTLRLALAIGWTARSENDSTVFCLPPDHPASPGLMELSSRVAPASECGLSSQANLERAGGRPNLRHLPTGIEAVGIRAGQPRWVWPDRVEVSVGYHIGPLWAADYLCVLDLKDGNWIPQGCRLTEIS
jgi:hypothetical protein